MHEALITIARMIALAHDHWRATIGSRRPLSGKVAVLEEQLQRLRAECALLKSRMQQVPAKRRPIEPEEAVTGSHGRVLLAKRPNQIWMIEFTRIGGVLRPFWVEAVIDAYSRRVLAIGAIRYAPNGAFAVRLLRQAMRRNDTARWLVSDTDSVLRAGIVQRLLTRRGILRRYGAIGKSGSIGLIERFGHSMKEEYVSHLFLYRSTKALGMRLERYRRWFNRERPHQGHEQRTPNDVHFARPEKPTRDIAAAGCTSGSTMDTRGSLVCAFATLRRSPPSRPSDRAKAGFAHCRGPESTRVRRVGPRSGSSEPR